MPRCLLWMFGHEILNFFLSYHSRTYANPRDTRQCFTRIILTIYVTFVQGPNPGMADLNVVHLLYDFSGDEISSWKYYSAISVVISSFICYYIVLVILLFCSFWCIAVHLVMLNVLFIHKTQIEIWLYLSLVVYLTETRIQ